MILHGLSTVYVVRHRVLLVRHGTTPVSLSNSRALCCAFDTLSSPTAMALRLTRASTRPRMFRRLNGLPASVVFSASKKTVRVRTVMPPKQDVVIAATISMVPVTVDETHDVPITVDDNEDEVSPDAIIASLVDVSVRTEDTLKTLSAGYSSPCELERANKNVVRLHEEVCSLFRPENVEDGLKNTSFHYPELNGIQCVIRIGNKDVLTYSITYEWKPNEWIMYVTWSICSGKMMWAGPHSDRSYQFTATVSEFKNCVVRHAAMCL